MTAEEVALRRFRAAVEFARCHRKESAFAGRIGNAVEQYAHWRLSSAARDTASDIANIIRAIRAEREDREAMHAAYGQGIRTAYETGRRDALRGVQAAALYRHAELWQGRVRLTLADERRDIEACELAWAAAKAAEAELKGGSDG